MVKELVFFCANIFVASIFYCIADVEDSPGAAYSSKERSQPPLEENHTPVVKITAPVNSVYEAGKPVHYTITVSDKEDGESKFEEIPAGEIFLQVKWVADSSVLSGPSGKKYKPDHPGFANIKASNCLNCHAFNSKLIGPSFYEISKRYPSTPANMALLVKHVKEGSTGVWGNVTMPTHPELTVAQTTDMVKWILKNAVDPTLTYYTGAEGNIRLNPTGSSRKGVFMLTASYTDHGLKDEPNKKLTGHDMIILRGK